MFEVERIYNIQILHCFGGGLGIEAAYGYHKVKRAFKRYQRGSGLQRSWLRASGFRVRLTCLGKWDLSNIILVKHFAEIET